MPPALHIGPQSIETRGLPIQIHSPIDGAELATIASAEPQDLAQALAAATAAFQQWRLVPAPKRGEFVRRIGQAARDHKPQLAAMITREVGKIAAEAAGEVQEWIDMCDFAVGLSRQLHGLTIASERPGHRMMEQWHPLGPVGVITAFNFPVAVWAWNAMLALVCGDPVVWKPSEKAPLTALACHQLICDVAADMPEIPPGLLSVIIGRADVGQAMADSPQLPLISATGSTRMGRAVAAAVAARLGRCLLELGGNNGMILGPSADLDLALRAITFAAAGTAGQRCTTLRRLILHRSLKDTFLPRLVRTFEPLPVGDPTDPKTLVGPLIDENAFTAMQRALAESRRQGATLHGGQRVFPSLQSKIENQKSKMDSFYVRPAIVSDIPPAADIIAEETFAPILYVMTYDTIEEAIAIHNAVPQGLSSAIFTNDLREAELFLSPTGSDCGIANVNIGTSGAEIGGAFGGEKATGGGRESGSDSWKAYMRRATNTLNYSRDLPLAQGIVFG